MALIDMRELLADARVHGHAVAGFDVEDLEGLDAVLGAAERSDAPLILLFDAQRLQQGRRARLLLTAMQSAARETPIPVALCLDRSADPVILTEAIRLGCNAVRVTANTSEAVMTLLHRCGVTIVTEDGEVDGADGAPRVGEAGQEWTGPVIAQAIRDGVAMIPVREVTETAAAAALLSLCGGIGQAGRILETCRRWAPVEHVIVYNIEGADEATVESMMATGREQLGAIPGVLDVFTGRALTANPKYRYCWLVRFAHPAVIGSYAEHPDHVAFADTLFRPIAGDRITIDYEGVESRRPE